MTDMLQPPVSLLVKLASLALHIDEFLSADGHEYDIAAMKTILQDEQVKHWLAQMDNASFLPKKRNNPEPKLKKTAKRAIVR